MSHVKSEIALLKNALNSWKYPIHPLRYKNLKNVNEEYLRRLSSYFQPNSFNQGRMQLFSSQELSGKFLICGLRKLTWDSVFFEFPIGRLEVLSHPFETQITEEAIKSLVEILNEMIKFAIDQGLSHIIATADPADIISINALETVRFRLKDTIFYHLFDLKNTTLDLEDRRPRIGQEKDFEPLTDITLRAFGSRESIANRFNADPQYTPAKIAEMYKIWLAKSLSGESADRVFVIDHDGKPAGYLTAIMPKKEQYELDIVFGDQGLGCVDPNTQGQGYFRILHKEVLFWFQQQNIDYALTRTAINTIGVNKTCLRHGSNITCSPHTFHLDLRE